MVVAATAMFFAVASSAFILRARMANRCHTHSYSSSSAVTPSSVVVEPTPSAQAAVPNEQCGKMVQSKDADGKSAIYFTVCPPGVTATPTTEVSPQVAPTKAKKATPVTRGVEVRSVTIPKRERR